MRAGKEGKLYGCLRNGELTDELLKIFCSRRQRRTSRSPIRTNPPSSTRFAISATGLSSWTLRFQIRDELFDVVEGHPGRRTGLERPHFEFPGGLGGLAALDAIALIVFAGILRWI